MDFCPYCGKELVQNSSFCPFCGKKVEEGQEVEESKEKVVILYDLGSNKVGVMKHLSQTLVKNLQEVVKIVNKLPTIVYENADDLDQKAQALTSLGALCEVVSVDEAKELFKESPKADKKEENKADFTSRATTSKKSSLAKAIKSVLFLVGIVLLLVLPIITRKVDGAQINLSMLDVTIASVRGLINSNGDFLAIAINILYLVPAITALPLIISAIKEIIRNLVAYFTNKTSDKDLVKELKANGTLSIKGFIGVLVEVIFITYYASGFVFNYINWITPIIAFVVVVAGELIKKFVK